MREDEMEGRERKEREVRKEREGNEMGGREGGGG